MSAWLWIYERRKAYEEGPLPLLEPTPLREDVDLYLEGVDSSAVYKGTLKIRLGEGHVIRVPCHVECTSEKARQNAFKAHARQESF